MQTQEHPLVTDTPGTQRALISHHFGVVGARPKIYIQAGLHAGEIPGMLAAHHLMPLLQAAEAKGHITGEIVLVPVSNPIGLAQGLLHESLGRFELHSAENFNRHYPDLAELLGSRLDEQLGADAEVNKTLIRQAMAQVLAEQPPQTELASLRKVLLGLALDADMVLDLHCDLEAMCHLYTTDTSADWGAELARYLGAGVVLLAASSGGNAFDEACSTPWDALRKRYAQRFPVPAGCHASTVELRGLADVNDALASQDAAHIFDWLIAVDAVQSEKGDKPTPAFAPAEVVPLAGTDDIEAPFGGIVSFCRSVGERVVAGDVIAEMVDPLSGTRAQLHTRSTGLLYAREHRRFLRRGTSVAQVSGDTPIRSGYLLAAK